MARKDGRICSPHTISGAEPPDLFASWNWTYKTQTDHTGNPRFRRTLATAKAAGVEVEVVPCVMDGSWKTEEFLKKFPLGYLPAFEGKDGFKLQESGAIADYREFAQRETKARREGTCCHKCEGAKLSPLPTRTHKLSFLSMMRPYLQLSLS